MARLLLVVAGLATLAWSVSAAFAPHASSDHQLQEKATLLAIAKHFNHPVFANIGWVDQAPGKTYNESLPCGAPGVQSTWDYVLCLNGYVQSIQLDGIVYSNPLPTLDFYGRPTKERGLSMWAFGKVPGPIAGTIPWKLLMQIPLLNYVSMSNNALYGPVLPDNIDQLPFLQRIQLSYNSLSGTIPASLSKLTGVAPGPGGTPSGLQALDLSFNQVTGPIPAGLGSIPSFTTLNLLSNNMTGTLPADLGNSKTITRVNVGTNLFNGTLPASWGNMTQLQYLFVLGNLLTGALPQSYANMKVLHTLDISHNLFSGPYPNFTGSFVNLTTLKMSSNRFYGSLPANFWAPPRLNDVDISANYMNGTIPLVPTKPMSTVFSFVYQSNCFENGNSALNSPFLGNLTLPQRTATDCSNFYSSVFPMPPPPPAPIVYAPSQGSSFPIVAVIVPVIVVILLAFAVGIICWRRQNNDSLDHLFGKNLKQTVTAFSLRTMKTATKNFDQSIGKGGYGTVYKGILKDGTIIAVKRLDQVSKQGDVEFIQEVELLSRLHHRHLVNLVGFCAEKGERVLVYEYMAMGSLYEHIHGPSAKEFPLSWDSRTKIAIHIALGLEYLHYGADPPLIHRDIKSANILLSEDGYSKVADFGLCKEAPLGAGGGESLVPTATAVRGSFGYLDPEYVNTSILSEKSDVYSYGVVLLELISGHKSIHEWQPLAYWAEEYLSDREKTPLMVDPLLEGSFDLDELYALCDIARTCVQDAAVLRPTIRDVAKALVENLGHALSSYAGSVRDSASVMSSSQSDTSSIPSSTFPSQHDEASEYSYQNYSETLHWTPPDSGKMETSNLSTASAGIGRLPVPMPPRRSAPPSDSSV